MALPRSKTREKSPTNIPHTVQIYPEKRGVFFKSWASHIYGMGLCLPLPKRINFYCHFYISILFCFCLTALNNFTECITKGKLNLLNYFDLAFGLRVLILSLMSHQCS